VIPIPAQNQTSATANTRVSADRTIAIIQNVAEIEILIITKSCARTTPTPRVQRV